MSAFKRIMVLYFSLSLFVSIPFGYDVNKTATTVFAETDMAKTVIIDAGHGGFDGGAEATDGTLEKDLNLQIAMKLEAFLLQGGFHVIMVRNDDVSIEEDPTQSIAKRKVSDMKRRLEIINSNTDAIFISIHMNKFTSSSPNGAQVFYSPNNSRSHDIALQIQGSFKKLIQPDNDRVIKQGNKSIYLLNRAKIPALIVECGFLSNQKELALLKTEEYQIKTALAIYCGLFEYYGKKQEI